MPVLDATGHDEHRQDREQLHDRQRGSGRQVEEQRRLAVDLDVERRVARAAEQQDDTEGREREEEGDRGGRHDRRAAAPAG